MQKLNALTAILAVLWCCPVMAGDLPGPDTPGAINPDVTQENIGSTICVPNWTSTVRPPVSYTNAVKKQKMAFAGLPGDPHTVELDHRIPLACAGAPRNPANLWSETWDGRHGAHSKDRLEVFEHKAVCAHRITLAQCQAVFLGDFWAEYDKLFPVDPTVAATGAQK